MKKNCSLWIALLLSFWTYAQQLAISPDNGKAGKTLAVTITGKNTHFKQGSGTTVNFSGGSVHSVEIVNDNKIKASITIPVTTYTGVYTVWVYNAIDQPLSVNFNVKGVPVPPAPHLVSANPMSGNAGQTLNVTITGTNTHFKKNKKQTQVYFSFTQATATTTVVNDSVLKAKITIPATTYTDNYIIKVENPQDGSLLLYDFHVNGVTPPNPVLNAINPNVGRQGQSLNVTITGTDTHFDTINGTKLWFHFSPGSSTIEVNSYTPISYTTLNANIRIPIDAPLGSYSIEVKNYVDGSMILPNAFTVQPAGPELVYTHVTNAKPGQKASVSAITTRTHYKTSKPTMVFNFGGTIVNADSVVVGDDTLLFADVTIPPNITPGRYPFTITNATDGSLYGEIEVITDCPTHFTSTYDSISNTFTLHLDSITSTALAYHWDFGDGTYSSLPNPVHTFPQNKFYYVCLTATYANADSCTYCRYMGVDSTGHVLTRHKGFAAKAELFKSAVITGIPDANEQAAFILYPNPATDVIKVVAQNALEKSTIRIYGVDGRLLKQQQLQTTTAEVNISDLAKGVYLLQIAGDTKTEVIKFIKE